LRVDRHKRYEDTASIKTTMEKCMTEKKDLSVCLKCWKEPDFVELGFID
jgi:hypothetical protein